MFEIGERAPSLSAQLFPARRVSGRSRWHRTAHPAHADTEGPYVLLGHSYGGLYTQMYAARYSDEVAGVALVDSSHPGNSRALQKGGRCTTDQESAPDPRPPALALAVCVVSPLCCPGGLPLLRALLLAAAGGSTRPRGLLS
jgi:pimeloyl-ACP methyl ester carboxylesterase